MNIKRSGDTVFLELNRPGKANSLDHGLVDLVTEAIARIRHDKFRLLFLTGAGSNFCSGFDLSVADSSTEGDLAALFLKIELLLQEIWHAPFATACFVQGSAYGAGADLVCACDFRIGGPAARFRFPGPQFGLVLGTHRLSQRIGSDATHDLLFSGRVVEATEAASMGILNYKSDSASALEASERIEKLLYADQGAISAIRGLARPDTRAQDMLALVKSLLASPLKPRIARALATRTG